MSHFLTMMQIFGSFLVFQGDKSTEATSWPFDRARLMGNDDTDAWQPTSPVAIWLAVIVADWEDPPPATHWFPPPLRLSLGRPFSIVLTVNFDWRKGAAEGYCQYPCHTPLPPPPPCCAFSQQKYTLRYPLVFHFNTHTHTHISDPEHTATVQCQSWVLA